MYMKNIYNTIIIGAGASGLMCAKHLDNDNYKILERNSSAGRKLLLTGNGRCNLTNLISNMDFINDINYNSKFLYSCINNFGPYDIYDYFSEFLELNVEEDHKVFPKSNKSKDILQVLLNNNIDYDTCVYSIKKDEKIFIIETNNQTYYCYNLVVATGGTSFGQTGSKGDHIKFARTFKHPIVKLYPAETSVILTNPLVKLAGTSFNNTKVFFNKMSYEGKLIITHTGLSASVILKASEHIYLNNIKTINIDLLSNTTKDELLKLILIDPNIKLTTALSKIFTKKFSEYLLESSSIDNNILVKHLNQRALIELIDKIKYYEFNILRVSDISNAFVTGGGIDIKYLKPKSFESKLVNNLYFIGECTDLHGPIGGYNLTLAFSSGYACAKAINKINLS